MVNLFSRPARPNSDELETREYVPSWMYSGPSSPAASSDPLRGWGVGGDRSALAVPTLFQCVNLISGVIGDFRPYSARHDVEIPEQPSILRRPNPMVSRRAHNVPTVIDMIINGETFWRVHRGSRGRPVGVELVPYDRVSSDWQDLARTRRRFMVEHMGTFDEGSGDLIRLPFIDMPGELHGLGPISATRHVWRGLIAADKLAASNFQDGVLPSGTLKSSTAIPESKALELVKKFVDRHRGSREPIFLSGGIEYDVHAVNARDAQWIEHRQWTSGDMARLMGCPAGLLSLPMAGGVNLTYTNMRDVRTELLNQGCKTPMQQLSSAYEQLIPLTQEAHWDVSNYLPPLEAVENQPQDNQSKLNPEPAPEQEVPAND